MADIEYARYTSEILNDLPHWFNERKHSGTSKSARYLNIAGLELDDADYVLNYAYEQCYIDTIDIKQMDFCYKSIIPMPYLSSNIKQVKALNTVLYRAKDLKEFFGIDRHGITDKNLHSFESYYIDELRNIIYVRQDFNADAINVDGKITLVFDNDEITLKLVPHHIWNYLDEMGELVACKRLYKESNVEYKKRIADVFKNKANSAREGLINGIARELSIRRILSWKDPTRDIELQDNMIVLNSIKVNGEYYPKTNIFISDMGTVVLRPTEEISVLEDWPEITYVYGLEMHEFHAARETDYVFGKNAFSVDNTNHMVPKDIKLYNELYTVEEKPKDKLIEYIGKLNSESPIFWNDFHWNEHYWDQNEPDVSGVGFIPHLYNGSIRGFKKYNG